MLFSDNAYHEQHHVGGGCVLQRHTAAVTMRSNSAASMIASAVSAGHFLENSGQCTLPCASAGHPCALHCALPHCAHSATYSMASACMPCQATCVLAIFAALILITAQTCGTGGVVHKLTRLHNDGAMQRFFLFALTGPGWVNNLRREVAASVCNTGDMLNPPELLARESVPHGDRLQHGQAKENRGACMTQT